MDKPLKAPEIDDISALLTAAPLANDEPPEEATAQFPPLEERPCYRTYDDWLAPLEEGGRKHRPGLYYHGTTTTKQGAVLLTDTRISGPLHIDAQLCDKLGGNFGRLLRFLDTMGRWKTWACPMELLRGRGEDLFGELLSQGYEFDPRHREHIPKFLLWKSPKKKMETALTVGWHDGAFVLPREVIGGEDKVHFQSPTAGGSEYSRAGSLESWRQEVAAKCVGNPLLTFAMSVGFAGPLLGKVRRDGGGFHLKGDSSCGKTTALRAAGSIWSSKGLLRSWKATGNGLEAVAALHNDCLLPLDEINEADPREIGSIIYALSNGQGKTRATRFGGARDIQRWRVMVLSTGERTVAEILGEIGKEPKAGQTVRLLDVPVARKYGLFDVLHGFPGGRALSDAIQDAVAKNHGHAGRAFLEKLVCDQTDFGAALAALSAKPSFAVTGGEGQELRAGERFALGALAGELATEYGLTGWPQGSAAEAAAEAFRLWREHRGTRGNSEAHEIPQKVLDFISRHGDSRFSAVGDTVAIVRDRAGWWRDEDGEREYLFSPVGLKEALGGRDIRHALNHLEAAGILAVTGNRAEGRSKNVKIGSRSIRVYVIRPGGASHEP